MFGKNLFGLKNVGQNTNLPLMDIQQFDVGMFAKRKMQN